jgi:hypothetical protein
MMHNISEFERTKPTKTYKLIKALLKKYQEEVVSECLDDVGAARKSMAKEVKDDLLRLKKLFLNGE